MLCDVRVILGVGIGVGLWDVGAENSGDIGLVKEEGGREGEGLKGRGENYGGMNPQWNLSHKMDRKNSMIPIEVAPPT
jgi:hypothetical protein